MSGAYNRVVPVVAGADHRANQWRVLNVSGTLAVDALLAAGIVENKPNNGEDASCVYDGRSKFRAGGSITAGALLTVASGGFITAAGTPASGSTVLVVGRNLGDTVNSGSVGDRGIFDFANPSHLASFT